MKNLMLAFIIIFSVATVVYIKSPTKEIAGKEYKIMFGTPLKVVKL
jgi:hypothetical protein